MTVVDGQLRESGNHWCPRRKGGCEGGAVVEVGLLHRVLRTPGFVIDLVAYGKLTS